ncbi:hypothetical protein MIC448_710012 [Microbacterium sp. C448]|nr:hypothetical protein MIC448_710012 [Microbacterium sp. C448]
MYERRSTSTLGTGHDPTSHQIRYFVGGGVSATVQPTVSPVKAYAKRVPAAGSPSWTESGGVNRDAVNQVELRRVDNIARPVLIFPFPSEVIWKVEGVSWVAEPDADRKAPPARDVARSSLGVRRPDRPRRRRRRRSGVGRRSARAVGHSSDPRVRGDHRRRDCDRCAVVGIELVDHPRTAGHVGARWSFPRSAIVATSAVAWRNLDASDCPR